MNGPRGVAVDSAGNLYIADYGNNRIRKVSNGVITTVAGNGTAGFSGDNGPATSAQLNIPVGVAVDSAGNLYIADYRQQPHPQGLERRDHHRGGKRDAWLQRRQRPGHQRRVVRSRRRRRGFRRQPVHRRHGNDRIRKVSNGVITTVAGNGTGGAEVRQSRVAMPISRKR